MNVNTNAWLDYIEHASGKVVRDQFERALHRHASTNLLIDNFFAPAGAVMRANDYYFGLAKQSNVVGRNHDDALDAALNLLDGKQVDWSRFQFFTNPLLPVLNDHQHYHHPFQRVVTGPLHVFTFEFDEKDIGFFKQQCSWFRYTGRDLNCRVGELYSVFSNYADFLGIVACYSGNKSFHIHLLFDPAFARSEYKLDDIDVGLRSGFMAHWHIAKHEVLRLLDPKIAGLPVEPDAQLQHPECYRRLPGGSRVIGPKKGHPDWAHALGVPFGTRVPQVIMWQKIRKQAAKDAAALFFQPNPFRSEKARVAQTRNLKAKPATTNDGYSSDEFAYVEQKLRDHYPAGTFPEFVDLTNRSGIWTARFRNDPTDRNPASIMTQDHNNVLVRGKGAGVLTPTPLSQPLLAMMRAWRQQYRRALHEEAAAPSLPHDEDDDKSRDDDLDLVLPPKHIAGMSAAEAIFVATATDIKHTPIATRRFFIHALPEHQCILVKAPEGSGKSSAVTRLHPKIVEWLSERGKPVLSMYAFTDYRGAAEKCEAFNALQLDRQSRGHGTRQRILKGVVLRSFSRLYNEACKTLTVTEITSAMAAQNGCRSLWDAINQFQPEVMQFFRDEHARLWNEIGAATPVFFTVHAVAHGWRTGSPTRTMWAKRFWEFGGNTGDWRNRDDTDLGLLLHDEVSYTDIVDIAHAENVEWIQEMIGNDPAAWSEEGSLSDQHAAFLRWTITNPAPVINGAPKVFAFEDARSFVAGGMWDWTEVNLGSCGAYPDTNPQRPLYHEPILKKHRWCVRPRYWWRNNRTGTGKLSSSKVRIADRVIILTTEEIPSAVLKVADNCWSIFSLETPQFGRDEVKVQLDAGVTSKQLAKTAQKHRTRLGEHFAVISNKAKLLPRSQSPVSARGSNQYIGTDVLSSLMFLAPQVHEKMLVLNAYMGRDDCVLLQHIDSFNQTCGRNLGYRRAGNPQHDLIIHPDLFDFLLTAGAWEWSRYHILLQLTKRQRIRIRAAAKKRDAIATTASSNLPESIKDEFGFLMPTILQHDRRQEIILNADVRAPGEPKVKRLMRQISPPNAAPDI